MCAIVDLYSNKEGEISNFLKKFYENKDFNFNNDFYKINMWVCLDKPVFINVTNNNADKIIRYLYERYPY